MAISITGQPVSTEIAGSLTMIGAGDQAAVLVLAKRTRMSRLGGMGYL